MSDHADTMAAVDAIVGAARQAQIEDGAPTAKEWATLLMRTVDEHDDYTADDLQADIDADLSGMDLGATVDLILRLRDIRRRALKVEKAAIGRLDGMLDGRRTRVGDSIWHVGHRVKRTISDPDGFRRWLGEDYQTVFPLTPSTRVRITGLNKVAWDRGMTRQTVMDTFFEMEEGPATLSTVPLSRAAKKWQDMDPGEVR